MNEPLLVADQIDIGHEGDAHSTLAHHVSLTLHAGEVVCLLGPNGVGKSTLLLTLAGHLPPRQGRVWLRGWDVHALLPEERAHHLATFPAAEPPARGWPPARLSDGEQRLAALHHVLTRPALVYLLDEPTAGLDVHHRAGVMARLRTLAHNEERGVLLATHDVDLALHVADRLWLFPRGGPILTGAPEDLVLSGALDRAFPSDRVIFDVTSGVFRTTVRLRGRVVLAGNGLRSYWTRRALERAGWRVLPAGDEAGITVTVVAQGRRTAWLVTGEGHRRICTSIHDLISYLAGTRPAPGHPNNSPASGEPLPALRGK